MKYKKAESQNFIVSDWLFWIAYTIILSFTVIGLSLFMGIYNQKIASPPENLASFILEKRFFDSPNCFLYGNNAGVIDYSKFTQEQLNNCYAGSENTPAYKLTLQAGGETEQPLTTQNWISGGYRVDAKVKRVLVFKNGEIVEGGLTIERFNLK